jgi:hypothetical protein
MQRHAIPWLPIANAHPDCFDDPSGLVPECKGQPGWDRHAFEEVHVGATDAAGGDPDHNVARAGHRIRDLLDLDFGPGSVEPGGLHAVVHRQLFILARKLLAPKSRRARLASVSFSSVSSM